MMLVFYFEDDNIYFSGFVIMCGYLRWCDGLDGLMALIYVKDL